MKNNNKIFNSHFKKYFFFEIKILLYFQILDYLKIFIIDNERNKKYWLILNQWMINVIIIKLIN